MFKDLKYSTRHIIIYGIGNMLSKLVGLVLLPLYTSHLTTGEYGMLGYLEVTSQFLIAILAFSLPTALLRWCAAEKDPTRQRSIIFTTLSSSIVFLVMVNALLIPFSGTFSNWAFDSINFRSYFTILFLSMSFDILNQICFSLIRFKERSFLYITVSTSKFAAILLMNIYFVAYLNMGVKGIILSQLIGNITLLVFSIPFLVRHMYPSFSFRILREMMKYGVPLIFTTLSTLVLTMSDRYLIEYFLDFSALGIYSLGYKMGGVINVFIIQSFQLGFLPIAYKMYEREDHGRFFPKVFTYFTLSLVVAALGLSLFSREFIVMFSYTNRDFWAAYTVVPLISLSFVFKGMQYYFSLGLHYVKKTHYNVLIVLVCAARSVGLNFLLIPWLGILGAAVTINLATIIMAILYLHYSQKQFFIRYETRKIILLIVLSVVLFLISMLTYSLHKYLAMGIKTILFLSFPFLLYLFRFYEPVELQRIHEIWVRWRDPRKWTSNLKKA